MDVHRVFKSRKESIFEGLKEKWESCHADTFYTTITQNR